MGNLDTRSILAAMNPNQHCPDCGALTTWFSDTITCPHCGFECQDELEGSRVWSPALSARATAGETGCVAEVPVIRDQPSAGFKTSRQVGRAAVGRSRGSRSDRGRGSVGVASSRARASSRSGRSEPAAAMASTICW